MKLNLITLIILSLLIAPTYGLSQDQNIAKLAINQSINDISDMKNAHLPILRVNDIYFELNQLFNAQTTLEEKTNISNYDTVIKKTDEISQIKSVAFLSHDELFVLETTISKLNSNITDITKINLCFSDAKQEFTDERFEQSLDIIDTCYEKISNAKATTTRVQAMYKATSQNIYNYIYINKINILVSIIILILFGLLTKSKIAKLNISKKLENLKKERQILKDLIKNAQNEYFQKGNLNETAYTIKVSKFSEMIRDINRQIPILTEELERQ